MYISRCVLVDVVLGACLYAIALDAGHSLESEFTRQVRVTTRSITTVSIVDLRERQEIAYPSQLRPASAERIKFLEQRECSTKCQRGGKIHIMGPRATWIPLPLNSAPKAVPRCLMSVRLNLQPVSVTRAC